MVCAAVRLVVKLNAGSETIVGRAGRSAVALGS